MLMLRPFVQPQWLLVLTVISLLIIHQSFYPLSSGDFTAKRLFNLQFNASFQGDDQLVNIHSYLPNDDPWQTVLKENISTTGVNSSEQLLPSGRLISWSAEDNEFHIGYQLLIHTQGNEYQLDRLLKPLAQYPEEIQPFLAESEHIQVNHPEIADLWSTLIPKQKTTYDILTSIYQHTWQGIEGAPFKGTTDALTAARLGVASCNGKSRLFVALARLNGLPARLVGGLILENSRKKTSHQWVEVFINDQWISFDPTNGYFAKRPSHYLKLYEGDKALFRHTKNIGFDYLFNINEKIVSPALFPGLMNESSNYLALSQALGQLQLSSNTLAIILLFPLCTFLITFLRNVIGIKTFGIFMPILIASICMYTGLLTGLIGFTIILTIAWLCHHLLEKLRILKTARLAIVISIVSVLFILLLWHSAVEQKLEFGMLALMPVVIISFVSERIHQVTQEENWQELIKNSLGSILSISLCYLYLTSHLLHTSFILYPEFYLLVLAGLIMIGRWEGIRSSELIRFKHLPKDEKSQLLGINSRNRNLVYKHNKKELLRLATDKLASKEALKKFDIPVPETLLIINAQQQVKHLAEDLAELNSFVIKPNQGSQGKGILVIKEHETDFISASGKHYQIDDLKKHLKDILIGHHSQSGDQDVAYIEPLIEQDQRLNHICDLGLSDIRVILGKGQIISAMLRMPTKHSSGKANLHQGAIGIAIDIDTGKTIRALYQGKSIDRHPDSKADLIDIQIPYWQQIKTMSISSYQAIPLGYLGVDVCLSQQQGPLILEVNGRAGLEIQNIQQQGFSHKLFNAVENS